jgi:2-phosphosulfolactate phosphatase
MKIDVYFTPHGLTEERLKDHLAVVVDVLRSSTTICAALAAGAKEIIPAESIAAAINLAANLSKDAILLCGEREGKLIEGFHLANSPLEYLPKLVKNKTLIFGSTNGSPTVVKTRPASCTYIGGFVNLSKIVAVLAESKKPVDVICSGQHGQFSIEDSVCAGHIISELQRHPMAGLDLSDSAAAALLLYQHHREAFPAVVMESEHGRYLASIGLQADLPVCADLDRIPVLPVYQEGKIRLVKEKVSR